MERINECRVCDSSQIGQFLNLGDQPYANSLLTSPTEREKFYPLSLSSCGDCNLVQLDHTADPKELFTNYVWVTSTSSTARAHAETFYRNAASRIRGPESGYVLEVASNDGTFLQPFRRHGHQVVGVDPAQNIADIANANGIPTRAEFFGTAAAERVKDDMGPAKLVIARNVLPHVANLHDVVAGMSQVVETDGLLAMEIHYAKTIFEELHYDSIYHEHLSYFTVKSFERLLQRHNLAIEDIGTSPISGGSLVVFARKGKAQETPVVQNLRKAEADDKLNDPESWHGFATRVRAHREKLLTILDRYQDGLVVGYGASARSSTLLNYCGIGPEQIAVIADQNPLKQGLYTAGTHIRIDNPEAVMSQHRNADAVALLAWNFEAEITKILREKHQYQGELIVPLPNDPRVLS